MGARTYSSKKRMSDDAADWLRHGSRADDLYRGARLIETQAWVQRNLPSADEQTFIDASADQETRQKQADQRTALRVQNFQRVALGLALVVVLALIGAALLGVQINAAQQSNATAVAQMAAANDAALAAAQDQASGYQPSDGSRSSRWHPRG